MLTQKMIFRKLIVMSVFMLALGFMFPSLASAQYWSGNPEGNGSVAVKFFSFFPNSNSNGLRDFSPGLGLGVDGRVNFGDYFALAGELDYIGVSSASQTYNVYDSYGNYVGSASDTAYFDDVAFKLDALVTLPAGIVVPFAGIGMVANYPTFTFSGYSSGYSASANTSGSGVGMEIVGGADFMAGYNGAITAQISIPVSQTAYFSDLGTNIDVGGFELMVGYRFIL